tara:strand:- start:30457 stop:31413 length:957 start_codon:yes stop_codon:yes gene_type:complete
MNQLTQEDDMRLSPKALQDFAVVIPAFNEAPVIPALIAELRETFKSFDMTGEIIIVDDGSTDGTGDLAEKEACDWNLVRVLKHRANLGKTEAILTAVRSTKRTFIVLFDADLQHLPDEIPRFLEKLHEGPDIVTGRKIGAYNKAVVSTIYNVISRSIFRVPVNDLNSMKAFRREILDEIHLRHDWHRFFVVLAYARGYSVSEIDIELHPRRAGTSKYRGLFRIVVGVMDLMSIWFLLLFSRKPLILFGFSGLFLIGIGIILGGITFYFRFVEGFGFRPFLYLVILLETVGFLLVGFGFIAEMIANLREEVRSLRNNSR